MRIIIISIAFLIFSCNSEQEKLKSETNANVNNVNNFDLVENINLINIAEHKYWSKYFRKQGAALEDIYIENNKSNITNDKVLFFSKPIGSLTLSNESTLGPSQQVGNILSKIPKKLTTKINVGRYIKTMGYGIDNLYYNQLDNNEIEIFNFTRKLGNLKYRPNGKPDKLDLAAIFKTKSRKFSKKDYWTKYISIKLLKQLNYINNSEVKGAIDIFYNDIYLSTLGPSSKGFAGPNKQAKSVIDKVKRLQKVYTEIII